MLNYVRIVTTIHLLKSAKIAIFYSYLHHVASKTKAACGMRKVEILPVLATY
jgi:hypothetical protein